MLKGVENIILDLGGVIINLNHELTQQAFQQLFPENYIEIFEKSQSQQLFEKYETNEISTDEFIQFFLNYNPLVSKTQITTAWNSMLLDIPKERIALIKELSKQYNVLLLSNTNEIHYNFIDDYYRNQYKSRAFSSLFNKTYLSYQIGYRKPHREIFQYVLNDSSLNPSSTLFIDDSLEHIQTAKDLGIRAIHLNLNQQQSLTTIFDEY
jgi:HAD superfamily hydrolase (TIGR01509 family)